MKKYFTPKLNKIVIATYDIITTSGEGNFMDFYNDGQNVNPSDYFISN